MNILKNITAETQDFRNDPTRDTEDEGIARIVIRGDIIAESSRVEDLEQFPLAQVILASNGTVIVNWNDVSEKHEGPFADAVTNAKRSLSVLAEIAEARRTLARLYLEIKNSEEINV